tara:strand:+ start:186 stop:563 length:378 start_codon:yes stop_codon:yes gene_type:complete
MAEEELDLEEEILSDEESEYDTIEPMISKNNIEDITEFMASYESNKKKYKTSRVLSKYERTRILSERAQQLENGSQPYISNIERFTNSYSIAVEELNTKKLPFIIRRSIPHTNTFEYWKLNDLIF